MRRLPSIVPGSHELLSIPVRDGPPQSSLLLTRFKQPMIVATKGLESWFSMENTTANWNAEHAIYCWCAPSKRVLNPPAPQGCKQALLTRFSGFDPGTRFQRVRDGDVKNAVRNSLAQCDWGTPGAYRDSFFQDTRCRARCGRSRRKGVGRFSTSVRY